MPRLATAALVAWLALIGGAASAIACDSPDSDECCPSAPLPATGASLSCCAAAPIAPALLGSPSTRAELAELPAPDDRDRDSLSFADLLAHPGSADGGAAALPSWHSAADGRLTYLRTQRLRL